MLINQFNELAATVYISPNFLNGLAVDASAIGKAQYAEETAYAIFELD
jgi:hypothetical protein